MTLKRALMVLVLTAFAALSGCGDNGGRRDLRAGVDPGLGPITYVVTGVTDDGKQRPLVPSTEIRIRFADGRITLTAGCNTMSGEYALEQSRLTVASLATTDMGCDQPRMDQDTWLARLFEKPVQFTSSKDATIVSGSTVLALADRKTVSPDKSLVGTKWVLDTIIDGDVASSLPSGQTGSLRIDGNAIALKDGCSDGSGTVAIHEDAITFDDIVFSLRPCPTSNQVAPAFAAVLTGTATYAIEENRLTIIRDGHGLGFKAID
jgi:heat shock protein HslJ